jgi:hypothetical protein
LGGVCWVIGEERLECGGEHSSAGKKEKRSSKTLLTLSLSLFMCTDNINEAKDKKETRDGFTPPTRLEKSKKKEITWQ